jgi:tetratricopeptide (TPR) repeat protein
MRTAIQILFFLALLLPFYPVQAKTGIDSANAAYARGDYEKAAALYENLLASGAEAPALYYNLGNAYFRLNKLGKAILNYEKAKKLAPGDEDINYNLELAGNRVKDKIEPMPQLFIDEWKNDFRDLFTETGWSVMCILFVAAMLAMAGLFVAGRSKAVRRAGFWAGIALLVMSITSFTMARAQHHRSMKATDAIVTVPSITVKGSPSESGTKLFIIHEGTKVHIEDTEGEWVEVKIANGNVGWLPASSITSI